MKTSLSSFGIDLRVALCSTMLLIGVTAAFPAVAQEENPELDAELDRIVRHWRTSEGVTARNATPDHVFRAVEDFVAETNVLREGLGVTDYPWEGEPQADRDPVHLYAKTLELRTKIRRIQHRFDMPGASAGGIPAKRVTLDDVLDSMGRLVRELRAIQSQMDIVREVEPAPLVFGKTPRMVYKRLADASFLLDGIRGRPLTTVDVYRNASIVLAEIELAAESLGTPLASKSPIAGDVRTTEDPGMVTEVARQVLGANRKAIYVQSKLGMYPSREPDLILVRLTLSDVYDLTNTLVAEMGRINFYLGIDEMPGEVPDSTEKRLQELHQLVLHINENLDRIGDGITEEFLIQLTERHGALERARLKQEAERQQQEEAERALELERQRQAEAERQREVERLREAQAEKEREIERLRQAEAELRTEVERQTEDAQKRLETDPTQTPEESTPEESTPEESMPEESTPEESTPEALEAATEAEPALPPCPLLSASNAGDLSPRYPTGGRINYGNAVITVAFAVDEAGETIDEEVVVVPERSSADRPVHFDRFAKAAVRRVQRWSATFPDPDAMSCRMAQKTTVTVRFVLDR